MSDLWGQNYAPDVVRIGPITEELEWLSCRDLNEPVPGLFKTRLRSRGPWVPARVWIEEDRDPETGELMADQQIICEWSPGTRSKRWFRVNINRMWERLFPIDEDEFRWLMTLKEI